uniref:Uncharacterized protein n=1 Tax=Bionectria ochroleuca TaxID=29856 RepID=A0A8H7TSG4_BIOOC
MYLPPSDIDMAAGIPMSLRRIPDAAAGSVQLILIRCWVQQHGSAIRSGSKYAFIYQRQYPLARLLVFIGSFSIGSTCRMIIQKTSLPRQWRRAKGAARPRN